MNASETPPKKARISRSPYRETGKLAVFGSCFFFFAGYSYFVSLVLIKFFFSVSVLLAPACIQAHCINGEAGGKDDHEEADDDEEEEGEEERKEEENDNSDDEDAITNDDDRDDDENDFDESDNANK